MRNLGLALSVSAALFLSACGGGGGSSSSSNSGGSSGGSTGGSSTPVVLMITPGDVYLDPGESIQFQVTQNPNQNLPLTYQALTIGGPKVPGSVTSSGLYTASPDPWEYQLVVSAKNNGVTVATAIANIHVFTLRVYPSPEYLKKGQSGTFQATVNGPAHVPVKWSVQEPSGGTIFTDGQFDNKFAQFTSSGTTGTFHVITALEPSPTDKVSTEVNILDHGFSPLPHLNIARSFPTVTLLNDGRVLIAGGANDLRAELFDPVTNTFSLTGSLNIARSRASAVLLPDGRVLISGGTSDNLLDPPQPAEIYDPVTETFTLTGTPQTARLSAVSIILPSGRVMIVGGAYSSTIDVNEIYDPATELFTVTSQSILGEHSLPAVLSDGRVLIVNGTNPVETYDESSDTYTPVFNNLVNSSICMLNTTSDETLILSNGQEKNEIFHTSTSTFINTTSATPAAQEGNCVKMADGKIMIVGGFRFLPGGDILPTRYVQIYDPATDTFDFTGSLTSLNEILEGGTVNPVALQDGRVLVVTAGGGPAGDDHAEIWQ